MTRPTQKDQLEKAEAEARLEKIRLEKQVLARQLSKEGKLIEWLKASAVPITILGAIVALWVGFNQLRQTEENRVADRFEKALTRLSSKNPIERITAVSSLRFFLTDGTPEIQSNALQSLVDAMAYESEQRVETALVDAIADLKRGEVPSTSLNAALDRVIEHNRALTKAVLRNSKQRISQRQKEAIRNAKKDLNLSEDTTYPLHSSILEQLKIDDYLAYLEANQNNFWDLPSEKGVPLNA